MPSLFPLLYLPLFVFGMALARLYLFGQARSPRLHAAMLGIGVVLLVLIFGGTGASMLPRWTRSDAALALVFALVIFGGAGAAGTFPLLTQAGLHPARRGKLLDLHPPHSTAHWWDDLAAAVPGLSLMPWLHFPLYFGFVVLVSVVVFRGSKRRCGNGLPAATSRDLGLPMSRRSCRRAVRPRREPDTRPGSCVAVLLAESAPCIGHSAHHQVCIRSDCHRRRGAQHNAAQYR